MNKPPRRLACRRFVGRFLAVAVSAAMMAPAGVFHAFYYNNLFPEQIFGIGRSIEILLGPIIGGIGTLFGPIVGAAVLTVFADGTTEIVTSSGLGSPRSEAIDVWGAAVSGGNLVAAWDLADAQAAPENEGLTALLEVKGIAKSFHGLRALNQVSFDAERGAIVALIGPNGAGKTTLFNVIAGMMAPDAGEIYFAGQRIDGWRADQVCAAGIGRTFQIVRPFAALTVLDNVMVGALLRTKGVSQARRHAEDILEPLGLGPKQHLPAAALTLPDRKLLEVARNLATQPKLLLLDEVLAGLRPGECDQVIQLLLEIHQRDRMTLVIIEHVMRAVMALAKQIVVLHHGEVIAAGAPETIVRDPRVLECYLGEETQL